MDERLLQGLTVLFYATAPVSLFIYWFVICRRLYRNGSRFPTGIAPWRFFSEMRRYRDICTATSDSLSPYYIYWLLFLFDAGLGVTLIIAHYWLQNNQM